MFQGRHPILTAGVATLALVSAASGHAQSAQEPREPEREVRRQPGEARPGVKREDELLVADQQQKIEEYTRRLDALDSLRTRGDCTAFRTEAARLRNDLSVNFFGSLLVPPAEREGWLRRLAEIEAAGCATGTTNDQLSRDSAQGTWETAWQDDEYPWRERSASLDIAIADIARAHEEAVQRCDRAGMRRHLRAMSELNVLTRRIAQRAGPNARDTWRRYFIERRDMLPSILAELRVKRPRNCPEPPPPRFVRPASSLAPEPVPLPLSPKVALEVGVGLGELHVPGVGIGFVRDGLVGQAQEVYAGVTERRIAQTLYHATLIFRDTLRIGATYEEGEARNAFDIAAEPDRFTGFAYGRMSPGVSTGIGTPFGVSGETQASTSLFSVDVEVHIANLVRRTRWAEEARREREDIERRLDEASARFGLYGSVNVLDQQFRLAARGMGVSGGFNFQYAQDRTQDLEERQLELGASLWAEVPVSGVVSIVTGVKGGAYYRMADAKLLEINSSNFGPQPDRNFEIRIDEEDDGFGFRGRAEAGLDFRLGRNLAVGLRGRVDYRSKIGRIYNPVSGDEVLAGGLSRLETDDFLSWSVGGVVTIPIPP